MFQKQIQLFSNSNSKEGEKERDLIIFQIYKETNTEKGIRPNQKSIFNSDMEQLKKRLDFLFEESKNEFAVFLIGKDGITKLRVKNKILTIEKLFGTINAMPMRQNEIREDKRK